MAFHNLDPMLGTRHCARGVDSVLDSVPGVSKLRSAGQTSAREAISSGRKDILSMTKKYNLFTKNF